MFELEQILSEIQVYNKKLLEMRKSLDIDNKLLKVKDLEEVSADPSFWNNIEDAQAILQQTKNLTSSIESYNNLFKKHNDIIEFIEIGLELNQEDDLNEINEIIHEVKVLVKEFLKEYEELRITTLFIGEYDKNNAILMLHSGAGGTEACDWVNMLFRMYTRWILNQGFTYEVLDFLSGEQVGIKSVTIQVNGENAYGYLKSEKGIHRLVRLSPFDSSGKRHTSFASCDIMPEIDDDIDFKINSDDLRIDVYRASGAGGQHINKTSSAVRITHIPTNTVVQCQNERSQFQNKDKALKILKSKLYELELEKQYEKISNIRGELKEIGWGSQIRSYVFQPYNMVKDHRTNEETSNTQQVMDGGIDRFINSYLTKSISIFEK
ncbi:MAG: peptide chain release factor 2 [bacterium]